MHPTRDKYAAAINGGPHIWRFLILLMVGPVAVTSTIVVGGGSSAIGDLTRELILAFSYTNPESTFTYTSLDSTRGLCRLPGEPKSCPIGDDLTPEYVDFAGSDYALTEQQQQLHPELLLHLDFRTLARIFQCNITSWRDPAIMADNPDIQAMLPDEDIQVGYRRQGSGVYTVFFNKLSEADSEFAEEMAGGQHCTGGNYHTEPTNQQLGFFVSTTQFSLGVITLSSANALELPSIRVGAKAFARNMDVQYAVEAGAELMSLPPEFMEEQPATPHQQFLESIAWPFVDYAYIVFHQQGARGEGGPNCPNAQAMANFFIWIYTSKEADNLMSKSRFAPIRDDGKEVLVTRLLELTCGGEPLVTDEEYLQYVGLNAPTLSATAPAAMVEEVQRHAAPYNQAKAEFDPTAESNCSIPLTEKELFRVAICDEPPQHHDSAVLPYALHTIVAAVNIPGFTEIKLDFEAIVAIVQGDVKHFNDSLLVALNPGLEQVEEPIVYVASKRNTDVMRTVQRTILADTVSSAANNGDSLWGGCYMADVCLDSIIKQRQYVMSRPYTLAFLTGSISELQALGIVLADIVGMDNEAAVKPVPASILACVDFAASKARRSGSASRPEGCYSLTFQSYVMLHRDYSGPRSGLAIEAVKFWYWMLVDDGRGMTDGVQPSTTESISQLTQNVLMVELYLYLPDLVRMELMSLKVNGEVVLLNDSRRSSVQAAIIGSIAAVAVFLAGCGVFMFRRNRVLASRIAALENDASRINIDADSPLVKALKFLERMSKQGAQSREAKEAGILFQQLRSADRNAIPTALLRAATEEGDSSNKPIMSYLLGLTNAQEVNTRVSRSDSSSVWVSSSSTSADDPRSVRSRVAKFHRSNSQVNDDEFSYLQFRPSSLSQALPPQFLSSLGTSYFCNVLHLKKHGVQHPLAFVTYMVLEMTGLTETMKLNRGKLKAYLERLEAVYRTDNLYHNAWHAADVVQRVAVIMAGMDLPMRSFNNQVIYLAAILGAAIHDAAHPGRDNKYMIRNDSELARRFNDQHVLENHSINLCLEMMREDRINFVEGSKLQPRRSWHKFKTRLINVVLATDMANHFDILSKFKSTLMGVTLDVSDEKHMAPHMELILQMVIKCADLGHCTMMRKTHMFWSKSLEEEFFLQGDADKAGGATSSELSPLTDRDKPGAMSPGSQIGFFNYIILPMYHALAAAFPATSPLKEQAEENWVFWKEEQAKEAYAGPFCAQNVEWYQKDMLDSTKEDSMLDNPDEQGGAGDSCLLLVSRLMVPPPAHGGEDNDPSQ
eukprot:jgi/Tetstr1/463052/TSEL_007990.t1